MVNCKTGLRILENPMADVDNCHYGNNLSYGDTADIVNQFYPPTHITQPQTTDIPNPSTFLPSGYSLGDVYNAPALVGQNNPKFVNFPLPVANVSSLSLYNFQGSYDFHLAAGSPAIGKGNTSFSPINATSSVTNEYLRATVSLPNIDLGAFYRR
jgi:hypothetical protein